MAPFEVDVKASATIDVLPSAVLSLNWLVHMVVRGHPKHGEQQLAGLQDIAGDVRAELERLFGPLPVRCQLPDTPILAERAGVLLTDEADSFLDRLEWAAQQERDDLDLLSEQPDVREATIERLRRLREDPGLARAYRDVLARIWDAVRPEWDQVGREAVSRSVVDWRERLRRGERLADIVSDKHILVHPDWGFEQLLTTRPRIVLSPFYFAGRGGYVVDMTSYVHVGSPVAAADIEALTRHESEMLADQLKVLADGTRVAILRQLVRQPGSVMDLSRRFALAQPTVSNHVRLLRDAGLLDATRDGARVIYSASRQHVSQLLAVAERVLLE